MFACGLICHHAYQISSSVHCLQESHLPLCTEKEPQVIWDPLLALSVSHICYQAIDQSGTGLDPLHFLLPSWQRLEWARQQPKVVSQEGTEEVEGKLGPGSCRGSSSPSLEPIFQIVLQGKSKSKLLKGPLKRGWLT